ncbi:MAG: Rieske (2Fe-2S) iron-sulfur domain protein [Myxococcales bacterium]|nr:Rieske (2Fe-2S) iron-sulfur domain protein [Myxococcales bacterium]
MDRSPENERPPSRRGMLLRLGLLINGAAAALLLTPVVRYLLAPARKQAMRSDQAWVTLGPLEQFPEGQTRLATFTNPFRHPWDGETADIPCWVRHIRGNQFQVFAINCAHLGCPVRWFAQSALFLCPCHGGVYYEDGSLAGGPPPRGLWQYRHKIERGALVILAGRLPTLSESARRECPPAGSSCA